MCIYICIPCNQLPSIHVVILACNIVNIHTCLYICTHADDIIWSYNISVLMHILWRRLHAV